MPELPEVETISTDLNKNIKNLTISDFKVVNERTARLRSMLNLTEKTFGQRLKNQKIQAVGRIAKNVVIILRDYYLVIHLKMTGQLVYEACKKTECEYVVGGHPIVGVGKELPNKFTRAIFNFNDDSNLYFNDVRRFGWLKLMDRNEFEKYKQTQGVEPLSEDFTLDNFEKLLQRKKNVTIKQAIMDQKYLVGVGNIYADESLFAAGINPARKTQSLTGQEIKKLWQAIPKVLKSAIRHRGTSFNNYRDAEGREGNFIKYLKVYGRAGQPCKLCGSPIQKTKIGGRGTHWCPTCQK